MDVCVFTAHSVSCRVFLEFCWTDLDISITHGTHEVSFRDYHWAQTATGKYVGLMYTGLRHGGTWKPSELTSHFCLQHPVSYP